MARTAADAVKSPDQKPGGRKGGEEKLILSRPKHSSSHQTKSKLNHMVSKKITIFSKHSNLYPKLPSFLPENMCVKFNN